MQPKHKFGNKIVIKYGSNSVKHNTKANPNIILNQIIVITIYYGIIINIFVITNVKILINLKLVKGLEYTGLY